tara:strand:+ start:2327 stop:2563 length:237 start_codon:yes stop_codon:yes gene_type:complete
MNISKTGYKKNSKDKNKPYNVIPSGDITMKDVEVEVLGIDNLGNKKLMKPGSNYKFPGDIVLEIPINNRNLYNKIFKN